MPRDRRPSKQMIALIAAFADAPATWRHGYELMKQAGLQSGTLYPLLIRMTEQGLVEAEWHPPTVPGRPARHAYRLTAAGAALAHELSAPAVVPGGALTA